MEIRKIKMKIAFLNIYQNKVNRGAETFVFELSKRLSKNHEVDVISNVNYFSLLKSDYDLVIPTNGRLQVIIVRIITWLKCKKMIVSGQSGLGWDDKLNLWTFPDIFIGLTDYQCEWARRVNPFVKIYKIPNGVDLIRFNPQVKPLEMKLQKPIILSVGVRLPSKIGEISKGQDFLTKAAVNIKASVFLVGKGGDAVFDSKDMPQVYTACDLYSYQTSPRESFGISILEAMASNLPVVATNDPIRKEIVGDAGILVDPTNTEEYAKALQKALNTDWGDKPRKQAEKFSWDKIAEQYENICNNSNI